MVAKKYEFHLGGPWSFEIDCRVKKAGATFQFVIDPKVEIPDFGLRRRYFASKYRSAN